VLAKNVVPWVMRSCTAEVTSRWAWPTSIGPEPSRKIDVFPAALVPHPPPRPSRITTSDGKLPKVPPGSTRLAFSTSPRSISLSLSLNASNGASSFAERNIPVLNNYRRATSSLLGVMTEIDIWRAAYLMLRWWYGATAQAESVRRADEFAAAGDSKGEAAGAVSSR